jgi:protein SCO1/2
MSRKVSVQQVASFLAGLILQCLAVSVPAMEVQDPHAVHQAGIAEVASALGDQSLSIALLDLEVRDQDGVQHKFASDVIAGNVVALNFVYTSCATVCPLTSAIFASVQTKLGKRLGQHVRLVSMSINPVIDTPVRLKEYAERFHAGPDWIWLTGEKQQVERILKGMDVYTADYAGHPPTFLVGDASRNIWFRFNGLPGSNQIVAIIDALLAARAAKGPQNKE